MDNTYTTYASSFTSISSIPTKKDTQKGLEGMSWPQLDGFDEEELDANEMEMENKAFDEFFAVKDSDHPVIPRSRTSSAKSARSSVGSSSLRTKRTQSPNRVKFGFEDGRRSQGSRRTGRKDTQKLTAEEERLQHQTMLSRQLTRQISRQESVRSDRVKRARSLGQDTSLSKGFPCCQCGEWMDCGPTVYPYQGRYALSFLICLECFNSKTIMKNFDIAPGSHMEWQLDLVLRQRLPTRYEDQKERAIAALAHALADAKVRRDKVRHMAMKVRCYQKFELATGDFKSWRDGGGFIDYFGEMSQDRPHGRGLKIYSNGCEYFGSFEFGKESGEGRFWWPDRRFYEGTFQNGKAHGKGVMTWGNRQRYEGEFAMGFEHGMGTMTFPDGSNHQGRFRFGVRDGPGVFTRTDGLKEKRIFKEDHMEVMVNPFDMEPSESEALGGGKNNPQSLSKLCQQMLAKVIKEDPLLYSSALLQKILPKHQKELVAVNFVDGEKALSAQFKETIPKIAWEFLPEIRYCNQQMSSHEITLMMYFVECNQILSSLHLQAAGLNASGVKQLANILDRLTVLTQMNLSWNSLKNDGVKILAGALHKVPTLKELHLAGCSIGNNGASCLAERLESNQCSLEMLNLSFNVIGPLGSQGLSDCISENTSLTCLNLRSNNIGPDGAKILSVGLLQNCGSLKQLHIADNQIGDEMAALVAGCIKGNTLDVMKSFAADKLNGPLYVKL